MTSEQGDPDDLGHMPSMSSKTRELGELQDMYRKTLAASWTCRMGELPADECIENIFAGGDGWSKHSGRTLTETLSSAKSTEDSTGDAESGAEMRHPAGHHRRTSSGQVRHNGDKHRDHKRKESKNNGFSGPSTGIGGRTSIESVRPGSREKQRTSQRQAHEIDEFEAREDLRSWEISVRE